MRETLTAISRNEKAVYPTEVPFHPDTIFPEYPWPDKIGPINQVYALVRGNLEKLGLDAASIGKPTWNPFGPFICPGQTVFIKPNLVLHEHPRHNDLLCLVTHGSVVRALLDYVYIALQGKGRVIVGDSPIQTTNFELAVERTGIKAVVDFYQKNTSLKIELIDLRQVHALRDKNGHIAEWREISGDPAGYATFDLGADSFLVPLEKDSEKFRVSNYKSSDTQQYHHAHSHKYVVARSVIDADVIIDVPKMKTHCKVGVTLGLKNFVGMVGRKQCLAHHREGGAGEGGDEYPDKSSLKKTSERLEGLIDGNAHPAVRWFLKQIYRMNERLIKELHVNPIRDGGWYGNDTAWRMTLDLVRIAMYGRIDGTLADQPQRTIFIMIDGIVAGENEGPLEATPKPLGTLISGFNPVATDIVTATLMGFDYRKIPLLANAVKLRRWPLVSFDPDRDLGLNDISLSIFSPPLGWQKHVERVP